MLRFKEGQKLSATSTCDADCVFTGVVVHRTDKTVTIKTSLEGIVRRKIYKSDDLRYEYIFPFGQYSMAPIFKAPEATVPASESKTFYAIVKIFDRGHTYETQKRKITLSGWMANVSVAAVCLCGYQAVDEERAIADLAENGATDAHSFYSAYSLRIPYIERISDSEAKYDDEDDIIAGIATTKERARKLFTEILIEDAKNQGNPYSADDEW